MELNLLLIKSITLLYRESQLINKTENSSDLVRTVVSAIGKDRESLTLKPKQILVNLRDTAIDMCNSPVDYEFDTNNLLQRIKLNTDGDENLYEALEQGIRDVIPENQLKRNIVNLRKSISNHFKEQAIADIIHTASYELKFQKDKIKDMSGFIDKVISQLEPMQLNTNSKDPAIMNDIDIGDDGAMGQMFTDIKNMNNGKNVYKTGWSAINRMTQGGFRPGEFTMIAALQHKYKTGFTLSLFAQLAIHNTPFTEDKTKKPLILRISFEDELVSNLQFLYQYLKHNETQEYVDISQVDTGEMAAYVKQKLQINGFHIKMLRVDPTQWNYKSICNKIIELESQGYAIEVLMLDYLGKLPTIGCTSTGPMGTDIRDMFKRVRNFVAPRKIAFITPHQISTAAKQLIRSGMPEDQFVKEIAEKGYYSGCAQLDQECDLILNIHICKQNKETFLTVQRDKHRLPTILPEVDKYCIYKFPKGMPISEDVEGEDQSMTKLPSLSGGATDTSNLFAMA